MHGATTCGIGVPGGNEGSGEGQAGRIATEGDSPNRSTCPVVGSVPSAGDWPTTGVGAWPARRHVLPSHTQVSAYAVGAFAAHGGDGCATPGVALGPPAAMLPEHTAGGESWTGRPPTSTTSWAFGS